MCDMHNRRKTAISSTILFWSNRLKQVQSQVVFGLKGVIGLWGIHHDRSHPITIGLSKPKGSTHLLQLGSETSQHQGQPLLVTRGKTTVVEVQRPVGEIT